MPSGESSTAVAEVWRRESPRVIAGLMRMTRDLALAEDLAQDALVAALEQWSATGVPSNPGAWLMTVAKRRAVDHFRREERARVRQSDLGRSLAEKEEAEMPDLDAAVDFIADDQLRLMFVSCHPVLPVSSRVALTLRLLGGLTTAEVARALLADERAVAQRIVRAKRTLASARVPFEVPVGAEREARLAAVLEVVYLIFTEGYAATSGTAWTRPELCTEAIRLARLLADLAPAEPEVHGLLALLQLQASRLPARTTAAGEPVLLRDQDRTRWDTHLIQRGLAALTTAKALPGAPGPYALQAAIAACHARASSVEETDWRQIAALYDRLAGLNPSPVVQLNRAVAHGMAFGPVAGLGLLEVVQADPALRHYHLLPSVRADLLAQLGRYDEARTELSRAAAMARNDQERTLLQRRAESLPNPGP
ncbi:MAG TPA: sigma-70 family RNA polymerase sigma factor [Propionibacteriaceae bacterium]|nr:sigma-70 family RNA polymerase sigma factor [Propionibacteriaceae bacterium]